MEQQWQPEVVASRTSNIAAAAEPARAMGPRGQGSNPRKLYLIGDENFMGRGRLPASRCFGALLQAVCPPGVEVVCDRDGCVDHCR